MNAEEVLSSEREDDANNNTQFDLGKILPKKTSQLLKDDAAKIAKKKN